MDERNVNSEGMIVVEHQVMSLDDAAALRLLTTMAKAHEHAQSFYTVPEPDSTLGEALAAVLSNPADASYDPSDADAARAALILLSQDDRFGEPIAQLLTNPRPQRMAVDPVTGTLLTAGLLLALQTHVLIERDKEGRWRVKIEKKPTKDSLVAPIVRKLLSRWSG